MPWPPASCSLPSRTAVRVARASSIDLEHRFSRSLPRCASLESSSSAPAVSMLPRCHIFPSAIAAVQPSLKSCCCRVPSP